MAGRRMGAIRTGAMNGFVLCLLIIFVRVGLATDVRDQERVVSETVSREELLQIYHKRKCLCFASAVHGGSVICSIVYPFHTAPLILAESRLYSLMETLNRLHSAAIGTFR